MSQPLIISEKLMPEIKVGDIICIHVPSWLFVQVSQVTECWVNHVGVVVDVQQGEPIVAESCVPLSRFTRWSDFVGRSGQGRVAVLRLSDGLDSQRVYQAAEQRKGVIYDAGFDLHSTRQFCSRFVREVVAQAADIQLGTVLTFEQLLQHNPQVNMNFWKCWYLGNIPWQRETISPASLYHDVRVQRVFDGYLDQGSK